MATETVVLPSSEDLLKGMWLNLVVIPMEVANTILSYLFLLIGLVVALPFAWLNQLRHSKHPASAWNDVFRTVFRAYLFAAGIRIEVEGLEKLPPPNLPVLLAANHPTHLDGMIMDLAVGARRATAMTAPHQFFPWPLSFWLPKIGAIDVSRDKAEAKKYPTANSPKKAFKLMVWKLTYLKKTMLIFPEGHIERDRHPLHFKTGAVRIAVTADVPLYPVSIRGTDRVFIRHSFLMRPGTIRIIFHDPFPLPQGVKALNDHDLVRLLTSQLMCQIAAELPHHYYTPGLVNACKEVLQLHPVTRAAIKPKKK